jgi:hypothetical protein
MRTYLSTLIPMFSFPISTVRVPRNDRSGIRAIIQPCRRVPRSPILRRRVSESCGALRHLVCGLIVSMHLVRTTVFCLLPYYVLHCLFACVLLAVVLLHVIRIACTYTLCLVYYLQCVSFPPFVCKRVQAQSLRTSDTEEAWLGSDRSGPLPDCTPAVP